MFGGKTPVITQGQILAVLTFIVTQITAWGIVDNDQAKVLISAGGTLLPVAHMLADAFLRGARAKAAGASGTFNP